MSESVDLSPFVLTIDDSAVTFRFDPESLEQGFEYPPDLERVISGLLETRPGLLEKRRLVIDLEELPAISSKQLGAMLAVRKACDVTDPIRLLNLRPNVRELLHITRLGDFFDWD